MLGAERAARSTIRDKHVRRCSAWFGSVMIGFLAPAIFIRFVSFPIFISGQVDLTFRP